MILQMSKVVNLQDLHEKIRDQKLSIKVAYKFSKLFTEIDRESEFYRTKLQEIIDKYSEKDEDGNPVPADGGVGIKIQQDLLMECQKELNELFSLEVEFPEIHFTLNELETLELSVDDFSALLPFIEE